MFVNVSPAQTNFQESKCSLMFAQRAKKVTIASKEAIAANAGKIAEKKAELGELNRQLIALQQTAHQHNLEARRKEAEVTGLSHNIREHKKEAERLGQEQQRLSAKLNELRQQLQRLDAAGDEELLSDPTP
eukprot:gene34227-30633_t